MIIKYKFFSSSESFEKWQAENKEFTISGVTPVIKQIKGSSDRTITDFVETTKEDVEHEIFVSYTNNNN